MEMLIAGFLLGFVLSSCALATGFFLGRAYSRADRVISPTAPHPAPSIARRMQRIADQAIKRTQTESIKVISPSKKAAASLIDIES